MKTTTLDGNPLVLMQFVYAAALLVSSPHQEQQGMCHKPIPFRDGGGCADECGHSVQTTSENDSEDESMLG